MSAADNAPSSDTPTLVRSPAVLPSPATGRAGENGVTQAEDAFGFSAGRETLGLKSATNVRGFSPFAAGNVRIEGLYFGPFISLIQRLRQSTLIR